MIKKIKSIILPLASFAILLSLWEVSTIVLDINPIIVPKFTTVATTIYLKSNELIYHCFITFTEALMGLIIAFLISLFIGVSFYFSKNLERSFLPIIIGFRSIPAITLAPLVVVWFGNFEYFPKILLAAITAFFPIVINFVDGLNSTERSSNDFFEVLCASKLETLKLLSFRKSVPYLFIGLRIGSSFAIIGAIVAEFTGANEGIGYFIKSSTYYNETHLTFAGIAMAGLMGLILYYIIVAIEKIFL